MDKYDYMKELGSLYKVSSKECSSVDVPSMSFLMIDGMGDPNTSVEFASACEALFAVSYSVKFFVKKELGQVDYRVFPLEGLWFADDMDAFIEERKEEYKWTLMICQPQWVDAKIIDEQIKVLKGKKDIETLSKIRYETYSEGLSAQILHVGPFSQEGPTIQRLSDYIEREGKTRHKKHHEIYLSDVRRTAPQRWKTIIRQPMI